MVGQTDLFDGVIKNDERFVIAVQSLGERNEQLLKCTLREYPSLAHDRMENLSTHLKDVFQGEPFRDDQPAYTVTVHTDLDYAADQVYAHVKGNRDKRDWTHTAK